ncbi:hypothetical protein WMY93_009856 [Mugilogobius chulae]|uniref:Uncharacterized protein n=1 Tax=Mugilogobius chulae TaxID=88201 RepID=A0AAW0PET7_9GOBI
MPKDDMEQRYVQLQTEIDQEHQHSQELQGHIDDITRTLVREAGWAAKSEAMEESKAALKQHNQLQKKHLSVIIKELEKAKLQQAVYREKVEEMEKMKTTNRETQELINLLSEELIEVKSMQEYHWHLDTDKCELKTWTKALHMKQVKLEKELASININVEQLEKVNSDRSAQRLEAIQLNKHVLTLHDQIDQKKMLEAQLKYVKSDKSYVARRRNTLREQYQSLYHGNGKRVVDELRTQIRECEDEIKDLDQENQTLEPQCEEFLVDMFSHDVLQNFRDMKTRELQQRKQRNAEAKRKIQTAEEQEQQEQEREGTQQQKDNSNRTETEQSRGT